MRRILSCTLTLLGLVILPAPAARAADAEETKGDEEAVRQAGLATDGPALVEFFRKRTPGEKVRQNIEALVRDLGSARFKLREKACKELVIIGPPALGLLRDVSRGRDLEATRRAQRCIEEIERSIKPDLIASAARLLGHRKPPQAVETLLNYLPFAPDENVSDEIRTALARSGISKGKVDEALLKALDDKQAARRLAAGEALALAGGEKEKKLARGLLRDRDVGVRLRVALALVEARDKETVGALVALLPDIPTDQRWRVEQVLPLIAGEKAPSAGSSVSEEDWKKYCREWAGWWRDHGEKLDLARLDVSRRMLGLTLIVQLDTRRVARPVGGPGGIVLPGRVFEVGMDGKTRWEIDGLNYPVDAQVTGPNRVLITEYRNREITERNFKGEVLWRKQFTTYPMGARRLANGHTLVNLRNQVVELDRGGRELHSHTVQSGLIVGMGKTKKGQTVVVDYQGTCTYLDETGREVKKFQTGATTMGSIGSHVDVLPNGNVVIPQYAQNKVTEYDSNGWKLSEITAERPTAVMRLPNGNTLVTSRYTRRVEELDRRGQKVWDYQVDNTTNFTLSARRR
ncbi:MAG TPA: HEAT repeat domain-containing protein [Gemmataceae bacterium]|nr:HEAT repeat domain-containing protein [Gemmataceae bacterium]